MGVRRRAVRISEASQPRRRYSRIAGAWGVKLKAGRGILRRDLGEGWFEVGIRANCYQNSFYFIEATSLTESSSMS